MDREPRRYHLFPQSETDSNLQKFPRPQAIGPQPPYRFQVMRPFNVQQISPFPVSRLLNLQEPVRFQTPQTVWNANANLYETPLMTPTTSNEVSEMPECSTSKPVQQPEEVPSTSHSHNGTKRCDETCKGAIKKTVPIMKSVLPVTQISEQSMVLNKPKTSNDSSSESDGLQSERSEVYDSKTLEEKSGTKQSSQSQEKCELCQEKDGTDKIQELIDSACREEITFNVCPLPNCFDSFILGDLIGKGSFGNVYKAFNKNTSSIVAIKSYRLGRRSLSYFAKVVNETAFLKILSHPYIIQYIGSTIKTEYTYIAIEYCDNGCLRKLLKSGIDLPEEFVQKVMKQLLLAVYYLQTMCIVHGDIKPENIIIKETEPEFVIKLTDFGLSEVSLYNDVFREKSGTFLYMAPELHLGFPADYKSDLFSAGVVMFEMLYGIKPFLRVSKHKYLRNFRMRQALVLPQDRTSSLTEPCLDLVKNMLSLDKYKRLCGVELLNHPFIQLDPINDERDHYFEGYKCFLKGARLVEDNKYGHAYTEITTAILHLKIHSNRVSDMGLSKYLGMKIDKYMKYCRMLEERLLNNRIERMEVFGCTERLRCLLQSAPLLQSAFDLCVVGEMYYWLEHMVLAEDLLKRGFDILSCNMRQEPEGYRKTLLSDKLNRWFKILEKIHTKHFQNQELRTLGT